MSVANDTQKNASESKYRAVVFMVFEITALKMDWDDMGHKINKLDQARKKSPRLHGSWFLFWIFKFAQKLHTKLYDHFHGVLA